MSKYIDNLGSLKTENMMGPRLSTHKAMAQVLNQVSASRRLVLVGLISGNRSVTRNEQVLKKSSGPIRSSRNGTLQSHLSLKSDGELKYSVEVVLYGVDHLNNVDLDGNFTTKAVIKNPKKRKAYELKLKPGKSVYHTALAEYIVKNKESK